MSKWNFQIVVINTLDNLAKKELPISTLASTFKKNVEIVAIIIADAYYLAYWLKKAQIFAFSIKDLEF